MIISRSELKSLIKSAIVNSANEAGNPVLGGMGFSNDEPYAVTLYSKTSPEGDNYVKHDTFATEEDAISVSDQWTSLNDNGDLWTEITFEGEPIGGSANSEYRRKDHHSMSEGDTPLLLDDETEDQYSYDHPEHDQYLERDNGEPKMNSGGMTFDDWYAAATAFGTPAQFEQNPDIAVDAWVLDEDPAEWAVAAEKQAGIREVSADQLRSTVSRMIREEVVNISKILKKK